MFRIGHGYDVHRFEKNRALVLGGVNIPYEFGLLGHSDADVLVHALMDAILGALGMGDIGKLFPDNDQKYKNISSLTLLEQVNALMAGKGYKIANADCTIIAQKPRISPFTEEMRYNIACILECPKELINIKATTEEGLGFTGRLEGISAHAVCLLSAVGD